MIWIALVVYSLTDALLFSPQQQIHKSRGRRIYNVSTSTNIPLTRSTTLYETQPSRMKHVAGLMEWAEKVGIKYVFRHETSAL